ncbi:MAG: hypothetical protein WD025_06015 [Bacteriovoracaceae bacterium]
MSIRNQKKKVKILPIVLAFQMFFPAQLFAQAPTMDQVIDVANQVSNEFQRRQQERMRQQQAQAQAQQLQQNLGIKPVDPSQVPPVIAQNGCMVLQARTDQISDGLSCDGRLDPNLFNQGHYDGLMTVAEQNMNTLENFLTKGHERFTTQGAGCYEKAKNQLVTQLKAREEMLKQMKASIEKRVAIFKKMAEKDLKDIKKGQALLDGPQGADKATAEALKDFKFEDKFNDPQCKSLMADFQGGQGFRGIEKALDTNKEQLGAETFFAKKNQIEREIRTIAKEAYKQALDPGKTPGPQDVLSGIRTKEFAPNSQSLQQSFGIVTKNIAKKKEDIEKERLKVVGNNELFNNLAKEAQTGQANLGQKLAEYERNVKNSCMNNHFKEEFGSIDSFVDKLEDPNISKKANREGDSAFKNYVRKILSDSRYSVEEKMKLISEKQLQGNNSRYGLVSNRSFSVQGKTIGASARLRGSDMITLFGRDCEQGFESDDMGNGYSGRDIVKAMKNYDQQIKETQKEFASNLQTEILRGMTDCPEDAATGSAAKTCGPEALDANKGAFCVRTANACAANAVGCHEKAKKIVEVTRKEQKDIAKRYKSNMDKLKADLIAEFETVNRNLEQSSRMIDGMFQMGTVFEKNDKNISDASLELNFTDQELLDGVDPSLALEDPDMYKAKIAKNIEGVQKGLANHREQVVRAFDDEIKKYKSNYETELAAWRETFNQCKGGIENHIAMLEQQHQEQQREANEYNEELVQACKKFGHFRKNPCPTSGNEFGSLAEDIGKIAATSNVDSEIYAILDQCEAANSEDGANLYDTTNGGISSSNPALSMSLNQFCGVAGTSGASPGEHFDECIVFRDRNPASGGDSCKDRLIRARGKIEKGDISTFDSGNFCFKVDGGTTPTYKSGDECPSGYTRAPDEQVFKSTYISFLETEAGCSYSDDKDDQVNTAREDAQERLDIYKRQELIKSARNQAGEVSVAACEGGNNSGPGMPDLFNPAQQRGLAGGMQGAGAWGF